MAGPFPAKISQQTSHSAFHRASNVKNFHKIMSTFPQFVSTSRWFHCVPPRDKILLSKFFFLGVAERQQRNCISSASNDYARINCRRRQLACALPKETLIFVFIAPIFMFYYMYWSRWCSYVINVCDTFSFSERPEKRLKVKGIAKKVQCRCLQVAVLSSNELKKSSAHRGCLRTCIPCHHP